MIFNLLNPTAKKNIMDRNLDVSKADYFPIKYHHVYQILSGESSDVSNAVRSNIQYCIPIEKALT